MILRTLVTLNCFHQIGRFLSCLFPRGEGRISQVKMSLPLKINSKMSFLRNNLKRCRFRVCVRWVGKTHSLTATTPTFNANFNLCFFCPSHKLCTKENGWLSKAITKYVLVARRVKLYSWKCPTFSTRKSWIKFTRIVPQIGIKSCQHSTGKHSFYIIISDFSKSMTDRSDLSSRISAEKQPIKVCSSFAALSGNTDSGAVFNQMLNVSFISVEMFWQKLQ